MTVPPLSLPSDADLAADIRSWEDERGVRLTEDERTRLRIARRQELTAPAVHSRHPIGNGADPTKDQATAPNRYDLRACLWGYYSGTLATQINQNKDAATGMMLSDRFVSLMEIGTALKLLGMKAPDLEYLLERRYRDGQTVDQICAEEHYSQPTYYRRETEAIDSLILGIFVDFIEPKRRTS